MTDGDQTDVTWFSPDPGEAVVWQGGPRGRRILPRVVASLFTSALAVAGAWALSGGVVDPGIPGVLPWGVAGLVTALQVGLVAQAYLRTKATDYVLTDRNVYRKAGVLSETVTRVSLDRIQQTTVTKSVTGTYFDHGTVRLSTAGSGGTQLAIADVTDPEAVNRRLERARRAGGDGDRQAVLDRETVEGLLPEARRLRAAADRAATRFEP